MRTTLFTALLILFVAPVSAQPPLSILVENWYPYNYLDEKNQIRGSSTTYVKKLMAEADLPYELEMREWAQAYAIVKSTPNTLLFSTYKTPQRQGQFDWICPINEEIKTAFFALTNRKDVQAASIEDLKRYSVGIAQGTYPYELLKQRGLQDDKHLQVTKNNSSNLGMLLLGRVDVIAESETAIKDMMKKRNLPESHVKKVIAISDPQQPPLCLAINKSTDANIKQKLQNAHRQIQDHQQKNVDLK